jgi:hypothetical protein
MSSTAQQKVGLMWLQHEISGNKDLAAKAKLMEDSWREYLNAAKGTAAPQPANGYSQAAKTQQPLHYDPNKGMSQAYLKERQELRDELKELFSEDKIFYPRAALILEHYAKLNKRNKVSFDLELSRYKERLEPIARRVKENFAKYFEHEAEPEDVMEEASDLAMSIQNETMESERRAAEFRGDIEEIGRLTHQIETNKSSMRDWKKRRMH